MTRDNLEEYRASVRRILPDKVFKHSVRTGDTAAKMASTFGVDAEKALVAGVLHDCAKGLSDTELLKAARGYGLHIGDVEAAEPYLMHAGVSAEMAGERFGIEDDDIISAIRKHTVGAAEMSPLDKIVYVADMIEPAREHPGLDLIRRLAGEDLTACYREAYAHTLEYLVRSRKPIHPITVLAWNAIVLGGSR